MRTSLFSRILSFSTWESRAPPNSRPRRRSNNDTSTPESESTPRTVSPNSVKSVSCQGFITVEDASCCRLPLAAACCWKPVTMNGLALTLRFWESGEAKCPTSIVSVSAISDVASVGARSLKSVTKLFLLASWSACAHCWLRWETWAPNLWEGSARPSGQTGDLLADWHRVLDSSKNSAEMEGLSSLVSVLEKVWSRTMRTDWATRIVTQVMYTETWDEWVSCAESQRWTSTRANQRSRGFSTSSSRTCSSPTSETMGGSFHPEKWTRATKTIVEELRSNLEWPSWNWNDNQSQASSSSSTTWWQSGKCHEPLQGEWQDQQ